MNVLGPACSLHARSPRRALRLVCGCRSSCSSNLESWCVMTWTRFPSDFKKHSVAPAGPWSQLLGTKVVAAGKKSMSIKPAGTPPARRWQEGAQSRAISRRCSWPSATSANTRLTCLRPAGVDVQHAHRAHHRGGQQKAVFYFESGRIHQLDRMCAPILGSSMFATEPGSSRCSPLNQAGAHSVPRRKHKEEEG